MPPDPDTERLIREQRFLADSIPQQVWTAKPDGNLDSVNQQVLEYFQASRESILGAGWQAVLHPDDLSACLAAWTKSLSTGEPYQIEFRLRGGDGQYRWYLGRAIAQRDDAGTILKWFGTNTDIDEAKRTQALLKARAEYEEQLIGIVSHDLRNPLHTIGLSASVLHGRVSDPVDQKALERIVAATQRASHLIDDLLDFAQARTTGIPIVREPANLRHLARQVIEEQKAGAPDRQIELTHEGEEVGNWDASRLAQVMANLIGNALQHGEKGSTVQVRTAVHGGQTAIEIHNAGVPIPAEELPRLFEPFARGSRAGSQRGRSVGLGLYIAQQIVAAHQGTIAVISTADAGTTFRIELPPAKPTSGGFLASP